MLTIIDIHGLLLGALIILVIILVVILGSVSVLLPTARHVFLRRRKDVVQRLHSMLVAFSIVLEEHACFPVVRRVELALEGARVAARMYNSPSSDL